MPNWCNNSVEITHDDPASCRFVDVLVATCNAFIPEPDWLTRQTSKASCPHPQG